MRLGCCAAIDKASLLAAAGFDYLEVSVRDVLRGDEPSATWDATAPDAAMLPLPIEAANNLVPATHPIVGPGRDMAGLQDYMQRVAKRAQRLGIQVLVFGSGGARKRPAGVDEAEARRQVEEFTRMAGEICAHHGLTLVVEHLNRGETNTINTLADEMALVRAANLPNVAALLDSYHFAIEGETEGAVLPLSGSLRHVHVAEPVGRVQPGGHGLSSDKAFDFVRFFGLLKAIGYDGRVSIEGKWEPSLEEAAAGSARFLRQAWDQARRS